MIRDTDFRVTRKIKTSKGTYEITNVFFLNGRPYSVWLNDKYRYLVADLMQKEFEFV